LGRAGCTWARWCSYGLAVPANAGTTGQVPPQCGKVIACDSARLGAAGTMKPRIARQ
jgi:hypothetical protein